MTNEQLKAAREILNKIDKLELEKRTFTGYLQFISLATGAVLHVEQEYEVEIQRDRNDDDDDFGWRDPPEHRIETNFIYFKIDKNIVVPQIQKSIDSIDNDIRKLKEEFTNL